MNLLHLLDLGVLHDILKLKLISDPRGLVTKYSMIGCKHRKVKRSTQTIITSSSC